MLLTPVFFVFHCFTVLVVILILLPSLMCPVYCCIALTIHYTLCLKQVPTFKLSVTLSILIDFQTFLHCWKAYEICYEAHATLPTSQLQTA